MARSISIGTLGLHNFRLEEDSIVGRYDKHKTDQTGDSAHDKHLFSNPFDAILDLYLALGVWFALDTARFGDSEYLFLTRDTLEGAASQRFCSQLNDILDANTPELSAYIRPKHANTHSIRKGSGTYSQSGTTCPPPATATAGRGEWSLGRVFDLYLYLAEPADTYLGRILAGLDPLNENFASLPPHFIPIDPMGNAQINEAMHLCMGQSFNAGQEIQSIPLDYFFDSFPLSFITLNFCMIGYGRFRGIHLASSHYSMIRICCLI
ncbi:hypothetical protein MHU86_20320 [Fragilaria crotonensis]|nr:hypothetical protein MHU86_20320 [Fragilaria crotonensis]